MQLVEVPAEDPDVVDLTEEKPAALSAVAARQPSPLPALKLEPAREDRRSGGADERTNWIVFKV